MGGSDGSSAASRGRIRLSALNKGLILVVGLALISSLVVCSNARLQMKAAQNELLAVIRANEFLKKTLGDMTLTLTRKDQEIDRLERAGCGEQDAQPGKGFEAQNGTE